MTKLIVNLNEPREKAMLMNMLRELEGMHRITIAKHRPKRSNDQNSFYWAAIVEPFMNWLQENGYHVTSEDAHEILKAQMLKQTLHKDGHETLSFVQSTTTLDTAEFSNYIERCTAFLASYCGILVVEPTILKDKR